MPHHPHHIQPLSPNPHGDHPGAPAGSPWAFPIPSVDDIEVALGDRQLAYTAWAALSNCPPEMRVIATAVIRLLLLLLQQGEPTQSRDMPSPKRSS